MARMTRGILQSRVDYLNKLLGFDKEGSVYRFELDHHQPGGNTHTWKLILSALVMMDSGKTYYGEIRGTPNDSRQRADDLYYTIQGVIFGFESAQGPGADAYLLKPTHRDYIRATGAKGCTAAHIAPGGHCLNCGWR